MCVYVGVCGVFVCVCVCVWLSVGVGVSGCVGVCVCVWVRCEVYVCARAIWYLNVGIIYDQVI